MLQILAVQSDYGTVHFWNVTYAREILLRNVDGSEEAPQFFRSDLMGSANARGNLYLAHDNGVAKYEGGAGFVPAGLMPLALLRPEGDARYLTPEYGAGYRALLPDSQVAYRVVCVRKDPNGLEVRSRPSGAVEALNNGSDPARIRVAIHSPSIYRQSYDRVEIYRTGAFPASQSIDEEYQLVGTVPVSAFDESDRVIFIDDTAQADRGATLYTSPSREGMENANDRPPACGVMAEFKGCLFFGNTVSPHRTILSYNAGVDQSVDVSFGAGSDTLWVAAADQARIEEVIRPGMILTKVIGTSEGGNDAYRVRGTRVRSVRYDRITLDQPMLLSGSNLEVFFSPSIFVDETPYEPDELARRLMEPGDPNFGRLIAYRLTPPKGGFQNTLVIESMEQRVSVHHTLRATHGMAYDPAVLENDGLPFEHDVMPGVLRWSKPDEPEHVPASNYAFVGDKSRAILGLGVTRDSLFIFKEDGLFRLTGVNGQWTIDPFEPTLRCVLPSSIAEMAGDIYALTSRGLARITDGEVQIVSLTIADLLRPILGLLGAQTDARRLGSDGWKSGVNERDSEYVLLLDNRDHAMAEWRGALVYNATTKAFTTWSWPTGGSGWFSVSAVGEMPNRRFAIGTAGVDGEEAPRVFSLMTDDIQIHEEDPLLPVVSDGLVGPVACVPTLASDIFICYSSHLPAAGDWLLNAETKRFYLIVGATRTPTQSSMNAQGSVSITHPDSVPHETFASGLTLIIGGLPYQIQGDYFAVSDWQTQVYVYASSVDWTWYVNPITYLSLSIPELDPSLYNPEALVHGIDVVESVSESVQVQVDFGAAPPLAGEFVGIFLRPLTCTVEPRMFWEPHARNKLWFHATSQWSRFVGPLWLTETFQSANEVGEEVYSTTKASLRKVEGTDYAYQRLGTHLRQLVPRAHARSWHLGVRVTWQMVFGSVKLEGLFAEARPHEQHRPAPEGGGP